MADLIALLSEKPIQDTPAPAPRARGYKHRVRRVHTVKIISHPEEISTFDKKLVAKSKKVIKKAKRV